MKSVHTLHVLCTHKLITFFPSLSTFPLLFPFHLSPFSSLPLVLRSMFARHGLPKQLVSDNGPQFTLTEFADFMKGNRIKHILSAPYHPASNGLAERFVQTLKRAMKASAKDGKTLLHRLAEFLFTYRSTLHATTNVSPIELFQQRKLRTHFDMMKPDLKGYVTLKQAQQKQYHDKHAKSRFFFPGTPVMVRNF